jgi:phage replication O-like protein O
MADPQTENGYIRFATELWEALCRTRIPGEARQVLDVICRKTYGFNKKRDAISLSQLCNATGLSRSHVCSAITKLTTMNIITKSSPEKRTTGPTIYGIVKDYHKWRVVPKMGSPEKRASRKRELGSPEKGNRVVPKKGHTIDTYTKDTYCDAAKAAHGELVKYYCNQYETKTGTKYLFVGGKDGKHIKTLLTAFGLEKSKEIIDAFLDDSDDFITKTGHTVGMLITRANRYAVAESEYDPFAQDKKDWAGLMPANAVGKGGNHD